MCDMNVRRRTAASTLRIACLLNNIEHTDMYSDGDQGAFRVRCSLHNCLNSSSETSSTCSY